MYTELTHRALIDSTKGEQGFYDEAAKNLTPTEEVRIYLHNTKVRIQHNSSSGRLLCLDLIIHRTQQGSKLGLLLRSFASGDSAEGRPGWLSFLRSGASYEFHASAHAMYYIRSTCVL